MWNPLWRRFIKTNSGIFGGIKLKMGKCNIIKVLGFIHIKSNILINRENSIMKIKNSIYFLLLYQYLQRVLILI